MLPEKGADVRVSDAEREAVVAFLRKQCGEGRLTLDEFSDRVGDVFAARTTGDLERVTADLPVPVTTGAMTEAPARTSGRARRAVRWTVSFLSGNSQKGRWRIEGQTTAVSFLGGCELDLRQAEVVGDHAVITCVSFMGGIDVIVPEGIEVVLSGFSFMGGRSARVRKDVPIIPGSPLIEVRAFAVMGGVSVRSKGESARGRRSRPGSPPPVPRPPAPPRRPGIEAVTGTVQGEWRTLHSHVAPDGTVTIMFSDIEGYTQKCERLGDNKAQEILRAHNEIIRNQVEQHGGFEVKVQGDGFMLAFSSAARALRCAVAIQRDLEAYNQAHPDEPVRVRMGLHTGEAIRDADDFLGTTVILASRIASSAKGGQILVSSLLRELCTSSGEFSFDGGVEVELKGLSRPHRVFAVDWRAPADA